MRKILFMILSSALLASCTIRSEVPYLSVSISDLSKPDKYPYKATYVPMNSDNPYEKRISTGSGITIDALYLIPVQKHINHAAETVLPDFFAEYAVSETPKADKGIVLSVDIENFNPETAVSGFSNCSFIPSADIKLRVADNGGREIYATSSHYEAPPAFYNCFSKEEISVIWNRQTYVAVSGALVQALKSIGNAYAVNNYFNQQPVRTEYPSKPIIEQKTDMTDKDKLKWAFENGYITSAQLSKAVGELGGGEKSKLLDAFLSGKIEGKNFGELY